VDVIVVLAESTPQIDDRDVDAADVADQANGLVTSLALVDLEVAVQNAAHAEPHQRVGVDHKALWALAQDRSILYPGKSASCGRKS
jgi:hypothetical protein